MGKNKPLFVSAALSMSTLAGLYYLFFSFVTPLLIFSLFLVCFFPWIKGFREKTFDIFEPVYFFNVVYFMHFGLRAVFLYLKQYASNEFINEFVETNVQALIPQFLDKTLLLCLSGIIAFLVGYYWKSYNKNEFNKQTVVNYRIDSGKVYILAVITFVIGMSAKLVQLYYGYLGGWISGEYQVEGSVQLFYYLENLLQFSWVLIVFLFYYNRDAKQNNPIFLFSMLGLIFFVTFLGGSKYFLIILMLFTIIIRHCFYKRARIKHIAVVFSLILIIVFPITNAYRNVTQFGDIKLKSIESDIRHTTDKMRHNIKSELEKQSFLIASLQQVTNRFSGFDGTMAIIYALSEGITDYQYGEGVLTIFKIIIPSAIYPGKYDYPNYQGRVIRTLFGHDPETAIGISASAVGDFYWDFHIFGILFGMFFTGAIMRKMYRRYFAEAKNPFDKLIYIIIYPLMLFVIEAWLYMSYGQIIRFLVILFLFRWWLNQGQRKLINIEPANLHLRQ